MLKKREKRGALNISFGWLFGIIVGGVILVLAIYGATKVIKTGQSEEQAVGAKEIGVLLNPLETGFESASSTPLSLRTQTKIFNNCYETGNFGKQGIQTSEFSFNKWSSPGVESNFENKYIFSDNPTEGKKFYIFSKPFEFPFKVSDLIYLTSENEKYCFEDAPEDIEEEISQLNQANLALDCSENPEFTKVCFGSSANCEINVNYNSKYVQKKQEKIYFETDALMYGAIFSEPEIYKCQIQRLMKRANSLAEIYLEKEIIVSQKNCNSDLVSDLSLLTGKLENSKDYKIISNIAELVESIKEKNDYNECLW